MRQRFLKSLGMMVPQVALGTAELGMPYGFGLDGHTSQPTFEEAARFVHAALNEGLRFIDTARAYGDSEEILGRCLMGHRHNLVIATKVGPLQLAARSDAEIAADITASVEKSLRQLRTDVVDWLMLHSLNIEQIRQFPRFIQPLEKLHAQGKFRALGASVYHDTLQPALEVAGLACIQLAASVIDRRGERILADSGPQSKDFVYRSVLLRGALTGRYHSMPSSMDPLRSALAHLDILAAQAGMSLTELAYRYIAEAEGLMLVGTTNIDELRQAVSFVERGPLSAELKDQIRLTAWLDDRYLNPARWPQFEDQSAPAKA